MGLLRVEQVLHFENVRRRAGWWRLWRHLLGRPSKLLPFWPIHTRLKQRTGFPGGIREIKLRQIVGSLDKDHLFDRSFHPLSERQRDRWITIPSCDGSTLVLCRLLTRSQSMRHP
jgi:hypothetical protein